MRPMRMAFSTAWAVALAGAASAAHAGPLGEEVLAKMTFDFGSTCGIYATGDSFVRVVPGGFGEGSRGALEVHGRTEKWNSGEFNLTGRVVAGTEIRFAADMRQDAEDEGVFQLSLKVVPLGGEPRYELVARKTGRKGEWTHVEGRFRLGKDVVGLYPYVELYSSTAPFLVDNVVFSDLEVPVRDKSLEEGLPRLKDAFAARGIVCGASVGDVALLDVTGIQKELLRRHFAALAPENQLKAQFLLDRVASIANLPASGDDAVLDFSAPRVWFDFAKENGMRVNAQALVWHMLTPKWWFHVDYDEAKPLAGRELMLRRMENYISRVLGWCESEYPGLVRSWVVVNEAVDGDAKPCVRDSLFTRTIGEDYAAKAFEFAGRYRPKGGCVFLYNDYNMEYYVEKTDFVLDYLKKHRLVERGLVDGIGFQCHLHMEWPGVSEVRKNLAKVAAASLVAEVTEFDVRLGLSEIAKFPTREAAMERQGERCRELTEAFLSAKDEGLDLRGFAWWGLTDAYTWLTDFHGERNFPLLFDADNKSKPAFRGVLQALTDNAAIKIGAGRGREVSDYLFGVNHRYAQAGYGMCDPKTGKVRPDFLAKTKGAAGAVRWPGGTIANLVNWKETIGPMSSRKSQRLGNRQRTEDFPCYGIDEHMAYCEAIGAKCIIMTPFAAGSAADAADLVEYLNAPDDGSNPNGGTDWAKVRAKNGHPKPYGVKYFEIGNEMWDRSQRYWMTSDYLREYANGDARHDGFVAFSKAMKAVDPSILVFSCIGEIWDHASDASVCDGVVLHEYRIFGKGCSTKRDVYNRWIRRGENMAKNIPENCRKATAKAPRRGTRAIVTEFGIIDVPAVYSDASDPLKRDEARMLGRALHFATILIGCAEKGVEMMVHQGYTAYAFGNGQNLGSAGRVYNAMFAPDPKNPGKTIASATGLAYKMFEPIRGGELLDSSVAGNPSVSLGADGKCPALRVIASRKGGRTTVLVVNRDPEKAVSASVSVDGAKTPACVRAKVLTAADFAASNTPEHPEDVRIETVEMKASSGALKFAPHSITVFEL